MALTMYPHGAMMFCESMAEFDHLVEWPRKNNSSFLSEAYGLMQEDPVEKTIRKLSEVFKKYVNPFISMDYSMSEFEDALFKLQRFQTAFTAMVNETRSILYKVYSKVLMLEDPATFAGAAINGHVGFYMKRSLDIENMGLNEFQYEENGSKVFTEDEEGIQKIIDFVFTNSKTLDVPMLQNSFYPMIGDHVHVFQTFDSVVDMIRGTLLEYERLIRLEHREVKTLHLDYLMHRSYVHEEDSYIKRYKHQYRKHRGVAQMNITMSTTLRNTCMEIYDLICGATDHTLTSEVFENHMKYMMQRIVNLFGIATLYIMHLAYHARGIIQEYEAWASFDAALMAGLNRSEDTAIM